jgi:hypothetical protein
MLIGEKPPACAPWITMRPISRGLMLYFSANPRAMGAMIGMNRLKSITKPASKKTVKRFLTRLGPLSVGEALGTLRTYLETGDNGQPVTYVNDDPTVDKKIRGLVHQIMSLPEFQLN